MQKLAFLVLIILAFTGPGEELINLGTNIIEGMQNDHQVWEQQNECIAGMTSYVDREFIIRTITDTGRGSCSLK